MNRFMVVIQLACLAVRECSNFDIVHLILIKLDTITTQVKESIASDFQSRSQTLQGRSSDKVTCCHIDKNFLLYNLI